MNCIMSHFVIWKPSGNGCRTGAARASPTMRSIKAIRSAPAGIFWCIIWRRYKKTSQNEIPHNKNIETEPLKDPKFRKPRTETQKQWNFALCSLRRLLSDLRPKLARAACSNKGLRSDAMLAHKANSNVSAYSVRGFRNFYLIGSVTIIKTVQP